ncbi:MAG: permease, partial [Deltaproteobacteria bacterium]|nr:permease [Deltaproteobacteria bacterium]
MIRRAIKKVGFGGAFLCLVVAAYMGLAILDYDRLGNALSASGRLTLRIAPILLLVFVVMFLTNLFFEGNRIVNFLGRGSGFRGWMVAIGGGILSSGPIYMWYPLLSDLKEKGMEDALIAAFLYNRAIK